MNTDLVPTVCAATAIFNWVLLTKVTAVAGTRSIRTWQPDAKFDPVTVAYPPVIVDKLPLVTV
jgi:hypothetical protein